MKTMPAHPDAEKGLKMLKDAGFRMVTLTNSPPTPGGKNPLENAGLDRFFERQFKQRNRPGLQGRTDRLAHGGPSHPKYCLSSTASKQAAA